MTANDDFHDDSWMTHIPDDERNRMLAIARSMGLIPALPSESTEDRRAEDYLITVD